MEFKEEQKTKLINVRITETLYKGLKSFEVNLSKTIRAHLKADLLKLIKQRRKK